MAISEVVGFYGKEGGELEADGNSSRSNRDREKGRCKPRGELSISRGRGEGSKLQIFYTCQSGYCHRAICTY